MQNIRDFGAVGDGKANDTAAIQAAIDAGGTVYVPDGIYKTGTLYLKSNGGLYLSAGARIIASHDHKDYNPADYCPQNQIFKAEFMAGTHLITAVEQENVFIAGYGCIFGDSHHWVNEKRTDPTCGFWAHPTEEAKRPAQMLFFVECKNVRVENVNLCYNPFWHLFFHGCTDVIVNGVNIQGERRQWVNDGIDIDCCSNVTVSNCIIDTGDDAIAIRANGVPLVKKEHVCENVVISNCTLTSYLDYAIRIGVGDGIIKNCRFDNLIIKESHSGIGITCRFSPGSYCTTVEDISFSNMTVEARRAIELKVSNEQSHPALKNNGYIKGLHFRGIDAVTRRRCYILGFQDSLCSDITFEHCRLTFLPEPQDARAICEYSDVERNEKKDCLLYLCKTKNIRFHHFAIERPDHLGRDVIAEETEDFTVE